MDLPSLLQGLQSPEASKRLDVIRVLGMVEETRALAPLREHFKRETDPTVRQATEWAGKRIFLAQKRGYSTDSAIFDYFGIQRSIDNYIDPDEEKAMREMQTRLDSDLQQMRESAVRKQGATIAAAGLGGMMAGGAMLGASMAAGAALNSNIMMGDGKNADSMWTERTPATLPSDSNISAWVKRLHDDPSVEKRKQATLELKNLNNPLALFPLADAFLNDSHPEVRQAAEQNGKILYWNILYYHMEKDGSLQAEINRRLKAAGKKVTEASKSGPAPGTAAPSATETKPSEPDISDILLKAELKKKKKRRR